MLDKSLKACNEKVPFMKRCVYQSGNYDSPEDVAVLKRVCNKLEAETMPESEFKIQVVIPRKFPLFWSALLFALVTCLRHGWIDLLLNFVLGAPGGVVGSNLQTSWLSTLNRLRVLQLGVCSNRLFYFAIPPFAYPGAARAIHQSAMSSLGWSRMVIEKPFGRDSESYLDLAQALNENFAESQV